MRIRTSGEYAYREDVIESVSEFYGRNKTESVLRASDDVPRLVRSAKQVLEREDLTHEQRMELADELSTSHFEFSVSIEDGDIVAIVEGQQ